VDKITFIIDRRVKPSISPVGTLLEKGNFEVAEGNGTLMSTWILEPQCREDK
jgi:hypothetical protein